MALFGTTETVRQQAPATPAFAAAWAYIAEVLEPGSAAHQRVAGLGAGASKKVDLEQGVFAIEQAYETKPRSDGFFESHRKYVDIQVLVAGEEIMEVIDSAHATVREPYQEARDLITYLDQTNSSVLRLRAGDAAIFFPVDVHMPTLRTGSSAVLVRKTVLKVPVGG